MIVTVDLSPTWLTSLADNTVSVRMRKMDRVETEGVTGSIANYGGRSTAEASSEKVHFTQLGLYVLDVADADQLRQWWRTSEPLLLRDNLGWWRAGVIFEAVITDVAPTTDPVGRLIKITCEFKDIDWNFEV